MTGFEVVEPAPGTDEDGVATRTGKRGKVGEGREGGKEVEGEGIGAEFEREEDRDEFSLIIGIFTVKIEEVLPLSLS